MFSSCPRYGRFHVETFLIQLCKDPFNCVSFKTSGKEGYGTCPSSPLSLISGSFQNTSSLGKLHGYLGYV